MLQPLKDDLQGYVGKFRKGLLLIAASLLALSLPTIAQEVSAGNAGGPASVDELKKELAVALDRLNEMQQELDAHQEGEGLQQQISAERQQVEAIEQQVDQISSGSQTATPLESGVKSPAATAARGRLMPRDIYQGGFFVETADKSYSLIVNGLFQIRYTGSKPANSVQAL
jgi:TolA-binding protein